MRTNANFKSSLTSFGIVNTDQRPQKLSVNVDYEIKQKYEEATVFQNND